MDRKNRKRIIIYALNFFPDPLGAGKYTGEIAESLAQIHEVLVITAHPYYPKWTLQHGSRSWLYRQETFHGAKIIRCPLWVPSHPTGLKRIFHLASFAITSAPILFASIVWKPQIIWTVTPTLFCAPAALLATFFARAKSWLHIQDFELDLAFTTGLLKGKSLKKFAERIETGVLQRFDSVTTISAPMVRRAIDKGVNPSNITLIRNWLDLDASEKTLTNQNRTEFRKSLGLSDSDTLMLYAGSMGAKQATIWLAKAAMLLKEYKSLHFIFCGEGSHRRNTEEASKTNAQIKFINFQPPQYFNNLLNAADIHMLALTDETSAAVMPSKLIGMLATGKPVVAMAPAHSEVGLILANKGLRYDPEDYKGFAKGILSLSGNPVEAHILGQKGREFALANFSPAVQLQKFNVTVSKLLSNPQRRNNRSD